MDESTFHALLTESDAVSDPEPVAAATLETLAEALPAADADAVARRLPDRYRAPLETAGEAVPLGYEAFLERVGDRIRDRANGAGAVAGDVGAQAAAVVDALAVALPPDELFDLRSALPDELGPLFAEGEDAR